MGLLGDMRSGVVWLGEGEGGVGWGDDGGMGGGWACSIRCPPLPLPAPGAVCPLSS